MKTLLFSLSSLALLAVAFGDPCKSINWVTREQWKAVPVDNPAIKVKPVNHTFIHHTLIPDQCNSTEMCSKMVRGIQNFHKNTKQWGDIGYSFLVGGDNKVYIGRGWGKSGRHTRGANDWSYAICLIGNFQKAAPSEEMLLATKQVIACGKSLGWIEDNAQVHGHRDQVCTSCPGDRLYNIIKTWPNFKGGKLPTYVC